ncbi:Glycosyl transferase family 2 [Plantibacter flavus]|uniref:4,4'-diaponeurosporenoate glycosyltransferase n=1 Tax=Plantibacter flavus TaxID=150123 RepID=A0A3N2C5F6_9MICO|nr:glycosyl transferase family 2 [Plantibacter flavus]SMG39900.1 Glycosyl transferase family 2 [Plantibacter flavus]
MLRRIDAVVPAHDEEELIGACLDALLIARSAVLRVRPELQVGIVVVLDDCRDDTARIVRARLAGFGPEEAVTVVIDERSVGAARRAGVAAAVGSGAGGSGAVGSAAADVSERWIANTDADSRVPEDWFSVHADAFDDGVDVLLGTVRPAFTDFSEDDVERWSLTHPPGHLPGNVHGANLGVRADRLDELGGFRELAEHEDVDLVERARASGLQVVPTLDAPVETSGRRRGRTPGGYAAFLAETYPRS